MKTLIIFLIINLFAFSAQAQEPVYKQVEEYIKNIKGERPLDGATNKELILGTYATTQNPTIDGNIDSVWDKARELVAWDAIAKRNVRIKSLYSEDRIFFFSSLFRYYSK